MAPQYPLVSVAMKTEQLVKWFGSKVEVARFLGISGAAVALWGDYPPLVHQLLFERVTAGRLKAEPDTWRRLFPHVMHPAVAGRRRRTVKPPSKPSPPCGSAASPRELAAAGAV